MMPLLKKLNYKNQPAIHIINAPTSFDVELKKLSEVAKIKTTIASTNFIILFITQQIEINKLAPKIKKCAQDDGIIWFCYPKKSSKTYMCDFNRDTGWDALGNLGFEPVRMIAIDEDWSAIRFREAKFIKTITRRESFALSKEAKKRTTQKGK
jgi:hypothetical protein